MIKVTDAISLSEEEITEKFIRSSGPGGQNVNKVATAVQLRFNAVASPSLPEEVRARLLRLAGSRLTLEGEILIEADRHRTREQNRADALARLVELIEKASHRPRPRTKTRPTRSSVKRRLNAKKAHGQLKSARKKTGWEE